MENGGKGGDGEEGSSCHVTSIKRGKARWKLIKKMREGANKKDWASPGFKSLPERACFMLPAEFGCRY